MLRRNTNEEQLDRIYIKFMKQMIHASTISNKVQNILGVMGGNLQKKDNDIK